MEQKLYNSEIKNEYLNAFNEDLRKIYERIFIFSSKLEHQIDEDIFDMSIDHLKDVIQSTNPLTPASARGTISNVKKYINWAIRKGYTKSNINKLDVIGSKWEEKFVDFTKKLYFSEEEILDLEEELYNGQDAIIIRLLFEGLYGDGLNELINLKMTDINPIEQTVRLKDRELKVSERLIKLAKEAHEQEEYYNKNNTADNPRRKTTKLINSEFVLKSAITRGASDGMCKPHTIYRRLATISELFDIPYFTTKNIWRSGQIKMARDLYLRDGKLESKQLYEIAKRFNLSKIKVDGKEIEKYNTSAIKEYINSKNLKELYGIDVSV